MSIEKTSATRWWTLGVVALGTFMLMLDLSVVAVALPVIHEDLHSSLADLQWVFDAYALTLAVFLVAAGSIADRIGRRRVYQGGFAVFTLASVVCALAGTAEVLSVSRAVQGAGAAVMFAAGPALLTHEFPGKARATAFTAYGAAAGLAVAVGPLIGGSLTNGLSWRWIFFINVPVGIVAIVVGALRVRESRNRSAHPVDWGGLVALSVALGALVLAMIRAPEEGWTGALTITLYAVAAVFLVVFCLIERRLGERAMIDLGLFRSPTFTGNSVIGLLANAGILPAVFLMTSYLENVQGADAWLAGRQFLPMTLAMFVAGLVGGRFIGKVPFGLLMGGSSVVMGAGLALARLTGADSTWTVLVPCMLIAGLGLGVFTPARTALAVAVVEPARSGVAAGISQTFAQAGMAIGVAAAGSYFGNQVSAHFTDSAVGQQLGYAASDRAAEGISAGGIDAVAAAAGPLHDQVLAAARAAYLSAFHDALTLCAALCIVGGIVGLVLIRRRDLDPSSLTDDEAADVPTAVVVD